MKLTAEHVKFFELDTLGKLPEVYAEYDAQASIQSSKLPTKKELRGGLGASLLQKILKVDLS